MWVNCALKKHDLALFQRTISQKPGFSGFSRAPRKITQQKDAHSGVLRADRGVPPSAGRGDWLPELIRNTRFTS